MPLSYLNGVVVGRDPRSITVKRARTDERIVIRDLTGDLELLLELLADGRDCAAAVEAMVAHRDGATHAGVWSAIAKLSALGLIRPAEPSAIGTLTIRRGVAALTR